MNIGSIPPSKLSDIAFIDQNRQADYTCLHRLVFVIYTSVFTRATSSNTVVLKQQKVSDKRSTQNSLCSETGNELQLQRGRIGADVAFKTIIKQTLIIKNFPVLRFPSSSNDFNGSGL